MQLSPNEGKQLILAYIHSFVTERLLLTRVARHAKHNNTATRLDLKIEGFIEFLSFYEYSNINTNKVLNALFTL